MSNNFLLPSAYLAPIHYYAILLKHSCIIENHEYFVKQSIRNHCNIYAANGKLRLTIPKQRAKKNNKRITNIKICYENNWQKIHWNSITSAYNSSPFFRYYKDQLEPLYEKKEIYLTVFNKNIQQRILDLLKIDIEYLTTQKYERTGIFTDLRNYSWNTGKQQKYEQVFIEKYGFIPYLSILDLLFNLGPSSSNYLHNLDTKSIF